MADKRIATTPRIIRVTPRSKLLPQSVATNQSTLKSLKTTSTPTKPASEAVFTQSATQSTVARNQQGVYFQILPNAVQTSSSTSSNLVIQPQNVQKPAVSKLVLSAGSTVQKASTATATNVNNSPKWPGLNEKNPIMRGIIQKLDPIFIPSHIVVTAVIRKENEGLDIQVNDVIRKESDDMKMQVNEVIWKENETPKIQEKGLPLLVHAQTMTENGVNRQTQCSQKITPVRTHVKAIQVNIRSKTRKMSDSECIQSEDSEEDLWFAPPVKKDYEEKCRKIDENTFECTECGLIKNLKHVLIRHIQGHDEKSTLCQFCGKLCSSSKLALVQHEKYCIQHNSGINRTRGRLRERRKDGRGRKRETPQERICPYCNRESRSYIMHRDHMNSHTKERPNICSCGARFRCVYNLYVHRDRFGCSAKGSFSPYVEDIGDENSGKRRQLARKERQENKKIKLSTKRKERPKKNSEPETFEGVCDVCNKIFTNKECFARHKWIHQERRFVCQDCSKAYQSLPQLRVHIQLTHLNQVKCKFCKTFISARRYKSHINRHKGNPTINCSLCSAKFYSTQGLQMHVKKMHGNDANKNRPKELNCYLCGPTSTGRAKIHLQGRHHFAREKEWKEEHKIYQYPCLRCFNMYFDTYFDLYQHVWNKHHAFIFARMATILEDIVKDARKYSDQDSKEKGDEQIDGSDSNSIAWKEVKYEDLRGNAIQTDELDIHDVVEIKKELQVEGCGSEQND